MFTYIYAYTELLYPDINYDDDGEMTFTTFVREWVRNFLVQ